MGAQAVISQGDLRKAYFAGLAQSSMPASALVDMALTSNDPAIITAFTKELADVGNFEALQQMMAKLVTAPPQNQRAPPRISTPRNSKVATTTSIPKDWNTKGHSMAAVFDGFHEDLDQPFSQADSASVGKRIADALRALSPGEVLTTHQIHRAGLGFADLPKDRPELRHAIRNGRAKANEILKTDNLTTQAVQVHGKIYAYYLREVGT